MDVQVTRHKRCDVVKMSGRIDSRTAPDLKSAIQGILADRRFRIVFDMGEINFLSSAGIWVLVEAQKKCKRYNRGRIVLVDVDENIQDSFKLVGLKGYFRIFPTLLEAVGSF